MPSVTHSRLLTPAQKEAMRLHAEGLPLAEIAAILNAADGTSLSANAVSSILSRLREAGFDVPARRRGETAKAAKPGRGDKDDRRIIDLYLAGASNAEIAAATGRSYGAVSNRILALKRTDSIPKQRPAPAPAETAVAATPPAPAPTAPTHPPQPPQPGPPLPAARHIDRRQVGRSWTDQATADLLHKVQGGQRAEVDARLTAKQSRKLDALCQDGQLITRDPLRYRLTDAGRQMVRDQASVDWDAANRLYVKVKQITGLSDDDLVRAARFGGLDFSASKIRNLRRPPTYRNYTKLTIEDLERILDGVIAMDAADDHT